MRKSLDRKCLSLCVICCCGCLTIPLGSSLCLGQDASGDARWEGELNGEWQFYAQKDGTDLTLPNIAQVQWKTVQIPHKMFATPMSEAEADFGWYRKVFSAPSLKPGHRLELIFHGVGPHAKLYVNGKFVQENFLMVCPWVVDITDFLAPSKENEILVGVEKRSVFTSDRKFTLPQGFCTYWGKDGGIWFEVWMRTRPLVSISDVYVQPSFRKKSLALTFEITNQSARPVAANLANKVLDANGRVVLTLGELAVQLPANQTVTVQAEKAWPNPRLWFPHDPYLYRLRSDLMVGDQVTDSTSTRFGFRE